ncbi:hypothetical protein [Deefgea sp. CFH1-16]|uniref:hypothetical protein n=1 Tax=Deefgea sp. CFH1-16 TaxID=2675457 RepID=UPI0015F52E6D|nr:hypothetical protein [Deefgea sp. CFH1-16]MBM5573656.1 hypothetical protein [Deefgea sp. CFH1-16]
MKLLKKAGLLVIAAVLAPVTFAAGTGPDLTALTSAVDFGTVITALLAIAGMLAGVYITIKGAKIVIGMIKGG